GSAKDAKDAKGLPCRAQLAALQLQFGRRLRGCSRASSALHFASFASFASFADYIALALRTSASRPNLACGNAHFWPKAAGQPPPILPASEVLLRVDDPLSCSSRAELSRASNPGYRTVCPGRPTRCQRR